jgi:hypothetical protein
MTEILMSDTKGYNTGKIIIGCNYTAPLCKLNTDDEFWQSVLLGDYQQQQRFNIQIGMYMVSLFMLFVVLLTTCASRAI